MGQTFSVGRPLLNARRGWLLVLFAALALLALTLATTPAAAENAVWGTLEMADVPMGTPVDVEGDNATFRIYAHWGGFVAEDPALLIIEPLPEGWMYQVQGGEPTGSGILLHEEMYEEGLMEVTVIVSEGTEPGTYYLEPRLDHSTEARTLASLPVYIRVPEYYMVPVLREYPVMAVVPGERISWRMAVETGVPVDRLAKLELVIVPRDWEVHTEWRSAFIRGGTSEPVKYSVTVADDALPGQYALMFRVVTDDPRVVDYLGVEIITVEPVRGFSTTNGDLHLVADMGRTVSGETTVVNDGNVPVTVVGVVPKVFEELPQGWSLTAQGLPVTIHPFSTETLTVGVEIPDDPMKAPSGGHIIPLQLMTDQGVFDIDQQMEVFVPEARVVGIEVVGTWWTSDDTVDEMSLSLRLRDSGNLMLDRAVWLTFDGGPAVTYIEVSQPALTMRSGSMATTTLTVRLDPKAEPGEHWVHLQARDGSGLLTEVGVPIQVAEPQLALVGGLTINAVQHEGHYAGGEASMYVVTGHVENQGDEDLVFAKVEVYDTSSGTPVHLGYVPIYDLHAGSSRAFRFTLDSATPGKNAVLAHPTAPGTNGDLFENSLESRFEAEATVAAPEGQYFFLVFAIAIGTMAGLIAILATEAGRFAFLVFILVPLYTRLKPEQVTDHFIRGQILGYVKANPGETYTHIKKALSLSNGTFVYHARILESQGHIRSIKDGANRRFYPAEMRIPTEVRDVELNQVQRMIYTIVMEYPGISQTKIAKMVKLAPSTVNYHVNIMTKVGVIERKRSGRLSLCFATEDGE